MTLLLPIPRLVSMCWDSLGLGFSPADSVLAEPTNQRIYLL